MTIERKIYEIEPVGDLRHIYESINYVIDLPVGEWEKYAMIRSERHLEDNDILKLPNGSWLEVSVDKKCCYGYHGVLLGLLKFVKQSPEIDNQINRDRIAGKVFKTEATYIA